MKQDKIKLDTTGEYLQIGSRKPSAAKSEQDAVLLQQQKVFLDNAFLFLAHREQILNDNKMSQAPVPFQSGLAYTGTNGLHNPTLGTYLEFWQNCPQAAWVDEDDRKYLVYHIAGSPLTGTNRCGIVYEDGTTASVPLPCFHNLWSGFMKINRERCDAAEDGDGNYTLEMVTDLLNSKYAPSCEAFFYKKMADYWSQRCKAAEATCENLSRDLLYNEMNAVRQQLTALIDDADRLQQEIDTMEEEIRAARHEMQTKLHAKEITPAEYQRWWTGLLLRKKKDDAVVFRRRMIDETLRSLFPEKHHLVSLCTVREFLAEIKSASMK